MDFHFATSVFSGAKGNVRDSAQFSTQSSKKQENPCIVVLVTNKDSQNQFAIFFISKRAKKIEVVYPFTMELK